MPDVGFKFTVDGKESSALDLAFQGRLQEVVDAKLERLRRAYPKAMQKGVVEPGKRKLRATIEATGFYRAASLAKGLWRGYAYPPGQPTLEPAAFFQAGKGRGAGAAEAAMLINAFEDGVTITVKSAQYLAVPEGPAKGIIHQLNRGRTSAGALHNEANPVARVAAALGTALIPIIDERSGRGVLVAANDARLTKTGRMAKRQTGLPTPLFALTRQATLKKRPMGRQVLGQLQASFASDFASALAGELGGAE